MKLRYPPLLMLLAAAALVAAFPVLAADATATARIPNVTRLVKTFLELEATLAAGIRGGDRTAVEGVLTEDFELRVAAMPGNPTPRDEWIRQALAKPGAPAAFEQMAVHDYGEIAVVSFLQVRAARAKRDPARDVATVDVWKRDGERWKLAVRYAGPAGAREFAVTGASSDAPIEKRY